MAKIVLRLAVTMAGRVETQIRDKLKSELQPVHLQVENESWMHNVPKGSETHFKVVVVSQRFDKVPLIARHRMVNEILQTELNPGPGVQGVHALSIVAKTPEQWDQMTDKTVEQSPACRGGFGK